LIHFSPIWAIRSTLVLFGTFCQLWFYSVHFVHFSPIHYTMLLFSPLQSYSDHFDLIPSTLDPLGPFCPLQSYSIHLVPIQSIQSYSLHLVHFVSFGRIWSIQITLVHYGPLRSIFVHLNNGKKTCLG